MAGIRTEATISSSAAVAVISLINEYLNQGGSGHDEDALIEARDALGEADRIVIEKE